MYRQQSDGSIETAHRGSPLPCPDGFIRNPSKKYNCLPVVKECEFRQIRSDLKGCCKGVPTMWCDKTKKKICLGVCKICTL